MAVSGELAILRNLYRTLETSAQDITRISGEIDRSLENAVWTGTNLEKFRDIWSMRKPTLTPELVEALTEATEDIRTQHNNLAAATGEADRI